MKKKTDKQHAPEITKRFILICKELIDEGICRTITEFADSVGDYQQNISMMASGKRYPTLDLVARTCLKYKYNPTWVILGIGDKKMIVKETKTNDERIAQLEAEVARIKRLIKVK